MEKLENLKEMNYEKYKNIEESKNDFEEPKYPQ